MPAALLLALVGWRYQSNRSAADSQAQQAGQRKGASPSVELAFAEPKTIVNAIEAVGSAESPNRVEISPKFSGRIEYLVVREGDSVSKGQVLVRIDPAEQQALVLQQQANLAEARSRLAQAQLGQIPNSTGIETTIDQRKADLASAKADFNQVQRNYDALVANADADVTDSEAKLRSSRSRVLNAQAELDRQQANLKNAKARLDRIESLFREGFSSQQNVEDARTSHEVQVAAVEVAKGQLSAATSDVESAQAQLKASQNQAQIARRKGLADIESARSDVLKAEAALRAAVANRSQNPAYAKNLAALEAAVRAAEAQLAQARTRLADLELQSPIDGTVTKRNADPGTMASPSSPILEVQSIEWLFVVASIPVEGAGDIRVGQETELRFDAFPDEVFRGSIAKIGAAADPQSRQFGVWIRLDNPGRKVRPGMFAGVRIVTGRVKADVTVPREAVKTTADGKSTVTVITEDGTASVREVRVGMGDREVLEVLDGVKAGERVIRLSYSPVRDGQKIKLPSDKGAPRS